MQISNTLALVGLTAILVSIFAYDKSTRFPSIYTLLPVIGVVLVILYAVKGTFAAKILSTKAFVAIGLISYSAYLWHQPLLAFAKIYEQTEPTLLINVTLVVLTLVLSYLSWIYIEKPFRDKSIVSRKVLLVSILTAAIVLVGFGYSSHKSHGFISRLFDASVSSSDMYISYNERNFDFKADEFQTNLDPKILVIGNSHGRDFLNILRETYDISNLELIYRDDYNACTLFQMESGKKLFSEANVIIFASNYDVNNLSCINEAIEYSYEQNSKIFFVGKKQFGYNLNWIAQTDLSERQLLRNPVIQDDLNADVRVSEVIPSENYISIMQPLTNNEGVLVTDEMGRLISSDRTHLTKYGAIYIGREIVLTSALGNILEIIQN